MSSEIVYAERDGLLLRAVVHTPPDVRAGDARAAVVLFFGGGWKAGTIEQFRPQCEHLAARGLIAVRGDYRVRDRHHTTPFDAMADARALISYVRSHARELYVDPTRIAAGGGSAGGHLAACAALLTGHDAPGCLPNALVLLNPVLDTGPDGFGHDRFGDRFLDASPLHHTRPGMPPTLILHGSEDAVVPIQNARAFRDAMLGAGNRCEVIEYGNVGHGFFNPNQHDGRYFVETLAAIDTFFQSLGFYEQPIAEPSR